MHLQVPIKLAKRGEYTVSEQHMSRKWQDRCICAVFLWLLDNTGNHIIMVVVTSVRRMRREGEGGGRSMRPMTIRRAG